jgi:hypothetical protein
MPTYAKPSPLPSVCVHAPRKLPVPQRELAVTRYLILAQSQVTANALNAWLELLGQQVPDTDRESCIVNWGRIGSAVQGDVAKFEFVARSIEAAARAAADSVPREELVVLVDSIITNEMDVNSEGGGWSACIASQILVFPEARWIFGVISKEKRFPVGACSLATLLLSAPRDPLCDPTGLRDWVRQKVNSSLHALGIQLPVRSKSAAAIDEEKGYAYAHAYTAYRFGFRADVVTSWALMKECFDDQGNTSSQGHGYDLLLEDMSLNFPDKPGRAHVSNLRVRGSTENFPLLNEKDNSKFRILITSGHDNTQGQTLEENRQYLAAMNVEVGKVGKDVLKPVGGMLDLWTKAGQMRRRGPMARIGNACGFDWPPPGVKTPSADDTHGAPGKLMLVAETLLRRAEAIRDRANTVEELVKGAVLANDAAEILGGRTPTLTLQALALKHEFEVRVECAFIGTGYHFAVAGRIREIALEVEAVARQYAAPADQFAALDAQIVILNRLAIVFRDKGQFEEESECMVALRRIHRRLLLTKSHNPIDQALNGVLWYAEFLLSSFRRFVAAIALWLIGLTVVWFAIDGKDDGSWKKAVSGVWSGFFGGNAAPIEGGTGWLVLGWSCVAVTVGFFHLGVFVSYLYTQVSRK